MKATTMSIRSFLPSWLGGYSEEEKAQIEANGGVIKSLLSGGGGAPGESMSGSTEAESEGMSLGTKMALGAGALALGPARILKAPFKAVGWLAKKTGVTGKIAKAAWRPRNGQVGCY